MRKSQVVNSRKPRNGIQKLLPVANFVEVPIRDPIHEKRLVENGVDARLPAYLCREFYPAVISGQYLETRIVETYKLL